MNTDIKRTFKVISGTLYVYCLDQNTQLIHHTEYAIGDRFYIVGRKWIIFQSRSTQGCLFQEMIHDSQINDPYYIETIGQLTIANRHNEMIMNQANKQYSLKNLILNHLYPEFTVRDIETQPVWATFTIPLNR